MEKTMDLVTSTFSDGGLLSQFISNYSVRPQQVELAQKIQHCIQEKKGLLGEAPTGVGKSLGALVPAFEHIKRTGEPVIVVTSSIILQEQYMNKDIPLLEKIYNFSVNPVLIKGRNNYLCPKKFNEARNGKVELTTSDQVEQFQKVMEWAGKTKQGDKSELSFVPSFPVWSNVSCTTDSHCTGKQCPFYSACHYYKERNRVPSSKLVICNYHYFFTAMNSPVAMLPPMRVVIMDEGHEINAIARDFQEQKYGIKALDKPIEMLVNAMPTAQASDIGESVYGFFEDMDLNGLKATLNKLFIDLKHQTKMVMHAHYTKDFWELQEGNRHKLRGYAEEHITDLERVIKEGKMYLDDYSFEPEGIFLVAENYGDQAAEWLLIVYRFIEELKGKVILLEHFFLVQEYERDQKELFWIQPTQEAVTIHIKPLDGSGLTKHLFEKNEMRQVVPIIMSATLTSNRSFEHIKSELGITGGTSQINVEEIIVTSPFDLHENMMWYLPPNTPMGNEKSHLPFTLKEMEKVIKVLNGKTLCLFTSNYNMAAAEKHFAQVLPRNIRVISQRNLPKQVIIDTMKAHDNIVVIATKSFFTGVDIQGPNLSAVLLDKMPFALVGDPVMDYLMSQPRGFHNYSLPEAIIALKQAFGRLNRTSTDKGLVAVFDGRLSAARYKNKIFNSFTHKLNATKSWETAEEYMRATLRGE